MIVHALQVAKGDDPEKMIPALEGWKFLAPKGSSRSAPRITRCCSRCSGSASSQCGATHCTPVVARHRIGQHDRPADQVRSADDLPTRRREGAHMTSRRSSRRRASGSTSAARPSSPMSRSRSRQGSSIGVIGPNGAGKTSLFNLLSGLPRPTSGRVELDGQDVTTGSPYSRAPRGHRAHLPGLERLPLAAVRENVRLAADARARRQRCASGGVPRACSEALERARLGAHARGARGRRRAAAGSLSHGDKRQLELAMVLAGDPRVDPARRADGGRLGRERARARRADPLACTSRSARRC